MYDVIVVGNGIMGATISAALRQQHMEVLTIDDGREGSGTKPSGGHIKFSWSGMRPELYAPAFRLLDDLWGLNEEKFLILPQNKEDTLFRLDIDLMRAKASENCHIGKVTRITGSSNFVEVLLGIGEQRYRARYLVLATGVWANELVNTGTDIQSKTGVSFRAKGQLKKQFIKQWAPNKQIVAHQQSTDQIWIGDGSALLNKNWTESRTIECHKRCIASLSFNHPFVNTLVGNRPYVSKEQLGGDPCYFRQLSPRTYVVTGAGKRGTIASAWASLQLIAHLDPRI